MTPASELDEAPPALQPAHRRALPAGTRLRDYEITGRVGEGLSSIVYDAWDHSLQRRVAVKEYLPAALATRTPDSPTVLPGAQHRLAGFKAGLKSFVDEARLLARFDHPSLVKVYRFWEDNGTAYMVMPFHEGPTLKTALGELGHVPAETELRAWLKPVLNAITVLHEGGTWHENIGPDEILLTPFGPVLLGFGAATRAVLADQQAPAAALKPGFAAIEQYGSGAATLRGPWTDLYALAAVIHFAIAGVEPAPAPERLAGDTLQPLGQVAAGLYSAGFLAAIDAALALQPDRRPRDHDEFRALMGDIEAPAPMSLAPRRDLMQEPFLGDRSSHREITVPDRPLLLLPAEATQPQAPLGAETKARLDQALAQTEPPADAPGRAAPSWMNGGGEIRASRQPLYRGLALALAGIGLLALGLQFLLRPATVVTGSAGAASVPRPAPAAVVPTAAAPAPAPIAPTLVMPVAVAPATGASTALAPALPASAAPALVAPALAAPSAPETPAERQARCIGILQKASLEQISAADTEFFKSNCK